MFSVIIPTHKRSQLLQRAIDSIKSQSFPHQIIVVSDAYCIDTFEICNDLLSQGDSLIFLKNAKGPTDSRNAGITIATSPFTIFLDDDDYFERSFFSSAYECIHDSKNKFTYYSNFKIDFVNELTAHDLSLRRLDDLEVKNFIPNNCIIYPTEIIKNLYFNHIQYEDWDFLLQSKRHSLLRHIPIFGPVIDKNYDNTKSRGEENNSHKLIDCYRYIYNKFPSHSEYVSQERESLFRSVGLKSFEPSGN